jgi:ComEC/Rec2-related protein
VHGGEFSARILKDARGSDRFWFAPARLQGGAHHGVKIVWEGVGEVPVAGAIVRAKGNFLPLPEPRNPGEFDRADWLRRQGVAAVFRTEWRPNDVQTGGLARFGAGIRHGFRDAVTAGLPADSLQARVIRAVVIGEQPPDEESLMAAFRHSGTLHVFSVSGLHVAMVGAIGWLVLGALGIPRRQAVLLLIPLVFGYSWITGHSAPAVRSAWMAAVYLGAFVFRRRPDLLNALGAVLLAAMLWDGRLLFQPGVQLSYGVVAAIAVGTAWTAKSFAWMAHPELYLPASLMTRWQKSRLALRRHLASSLAVSLAAGIGSAPLTALHFSMVTPVSVLASVVLVPLVFVLLCAALFAAAIHPLVPAVSSGVNRLNAVVADACVFTAEKFAAIPGGHFHLHRDRQPRLLVYDAGYGSGAACFSGGDSAVLIDCGSRHSFKRLVAPSLAQLGIVPDSVVLSHPDAGHLGGGPPVWERLPIRQVLLPVHRARSPTYRSWLEAAPQSGILVRHASERAELALPDAATLEVLHAPDAHAQNSLADERVAIYRLHWRGWKFLLTSDAGMGTELQMLDAGKDVAADVIIAGRHRADVSLCDRFLDAVMPQLIIATNAPYPEGESLPPASVAYWRSRGIQVIDQGQSGGVTLHIDPRGNLRAEGFLDPQPLILAPR